jgi:hypothetical protein
MKTIYIILISVISFPAWSQVGIGTSAPKGALDVTSSTMGIVYPQVALTDRVTETITNPNGGSLVVGTTVYNTTISGSGVNTVYPGIYVWDGTIWIPQYHKDDYKLCYQTADVRTGSDDILNPVLGNQVITFDTNSFTPKFNGNYLVTVTVHYGGGLLDPPAGSDQWVNFNSEEGQFDFTFNGTTYSYTLKSYSGYNDDMLFDGGSTNNHTNRYTQNAYTIPVTLTRNITYPFTLTFNQAIANGFQGDGDISISPAGDGRGYIITNGLVKCTVEFNYIGI